MKQVLTILLFTPFIFSCGKDEKEEVKPKPDPTPSEMVIGNWNKLNYWTLFYDLAGVKVDSQLTGYGGKATFSSTTWSLSSPDNSRVYFSDRKYSLEVNNDKLFLNTIDVGGNKMKYDVTRLDNTRMKWVRTTNYQPSDNMFVGIGFKTYHISKREEVHIFEK